MYPGFFISFEGIDGTGKSTQINLLADALEAKGHQLYVTKEPGDAKSGSNVGPGIRAMLFGTPGTKNVGPGVADLLFLADHVQNTHDIRRELAAGKVVLTDRYADSQFAYAASQTKQSPKWANKLFEDQFGPTPDLTILFVVRGHEMKSWPVSTGRYSSEGTHQTPEDISWALGRANARRGVEAGKQDGKAWNDVEEQRKIQEAYLDRMRPMGRVCQCPVFEHFTIDGIHRVVLEEVLFRMGNRDVKDPVLPMYEQVDTQVA